jgi:hypothetical protein
MLCLSASLRSSEVASGEGWFIWPLLAPTAEGVLRCLVRYEADRGSVGREPPGEAWMEDRRLEDGDVGADEAGDLAGGV